MGKKVQYYFSEIDDEFARTMEDWQEYMEEEDIDKIKLFTATKDVGGDYFYCLEYLAPGIKSDRICGKGCAAYAPRNGKSGICKHHRPTYEPSDEFIVIHRELCEGQ